jgi:hypothetical protein
MGRPNSEGAKVEPNRTHCFRPPIRGEIGNFGTVAFLQFAVGTGPDLVHRLKFGGVTSPKWGGPEIYVFF